MKVYISASWKLRGEVRNLASTLRDGAHEVYDFTDPNCRNTPEIPPEMFAEQFFPDHHIYSEYLNKPEWKAAVIENRKALEWCDVVILLLPCGIDATADWAYALGLGKKSVIVGHPTAGERSPTHLWADKMVSSVAEAVEFINGGANVS